jgi:hypothetical protein
MTHAANGNALAANANGRRGRRKRQFRRAEIASRGAERSDGAQCLLFLSPVHITLNLFDPLPPAFLCAEPAPVAEHRLRHPRAHHPALSEGRLAYPAQQNKRLPVAGHLLAGERITPAHCPRAAELGSGQGVAPGARASAAQFSSQASGRWGHAPTLGARMRKKASFESQLPPPSSSGCSDSPRCASPQALDNAQLRAYLGVKSEAGGVLLRGVLPTAPAARLLRRGDVLLQLDGHDIAHDGSFAIGGQVPHRTAARQPSWHGRSVVGPVVFRARRGFHHDGGPGGLSSPSRSCHAHMVVAALPRPQPRRFTRPPRPASP